MNAENAVSKNVMCSRCEHISSERKVNETCERIIETSDGRRRCGGTYRLTNGQRFKDLHGYSKTLKRNMRKHGLDPNEFSDSIRAYKEIRKKKGKPMLKLREKSTMRILLSVETNHQK